MNTTQHNTPTVNAFTLSLNRHAYLLVHWLCVLVHTGDKINDLLRVYSVDNARVGC